MPSHQGQSAEGFDARAITRPDPLLLKYYTILSLITGPLCVLLFPPMYFKYHTLRYRFDDEGVAASWGILWRQEVYLTYRRIQDIHVSRGVIQRWLGLANISVQTASGSATPELTIEGIPQFDALRDFLYEQMRGAKGQSGKGKLSKGDAGGVSVAVSAPATASAIVQTTGSAGGVAVESAGRAAVEDEALVLLRQVRDELALVRTKLERREVRADGRVGGGSAGSGGGAA